MVKKPVERQGRHFLEEMREDPELRKYLVPIPDYGMCSCIIGWRILKQLEKE